MSGNRVDPDQTPRYAASDLDLLCSDLLVRIFRLNTVVGAIYIAFTGCQVKCGNIVTFFLYPRHSKNGGKGI